LSLKTPLLTRDSRKPVAHCRAKKSSLAARFGNSKYFFIGPQHCVSGEMKGCAGLAWRSPWPSVLVPPPALANAVSTAIPLPPGLAKGLLDRELGDWNYRWHSIACTTKRFVRVTEPIIASRVAGTEPVGACDGKRSITDGEAHSLC